MTTQEPGFLATSSASSSGTREFPVYAVNWPIHPIPQELVIPNDQKELVPNPDTICKKRYATSVDERNYLTVYEYQINNQWIIWDYHTGYVHLTGLWKAIGNSKADIVKLIDNSPDLEAVIRRVRGGYLKIQGTWVPYDIARALASRTCYFIRFALIPLFGPDFPGTCLKPHEPGFGYLQMHFNSSKKRRKSKAQSTPSKMGVKPNQMPIVQPQMYPPQMLGIPSIPQSAVPRYYPIQPQPQTRLSQSAPSQVPFATGRATTMPVPISPAPPAYYHQVGPPSPHSQPLLLPRIAPLPSPPQQQVPPMTRKYSNSKQRPILIRPNSFTDASKLYAPEAEDLFGNYSMQRRSSAGGGITKPSSAPATRPRRKSRLSYDDSQTSLLTAALKESSSTRSRRGSAVTTTVAGSAVTGSSSESELDDDEYYRNFFARRKSISEYNPANSAMKQDSPDVLVKQESPEEIMEVLQAIRSLQQLSTGGSISGPSSSKHKVMDINSVLS